MDCLNCGTLTSEVNPTIRTLYSLSIEITDICTKCMIGFSMVLVQPKTPCCSPTRTDHLTFAQLIYGNNKHENEHYLSHLN